MKVLNRGLKYNFAGCLGWEQWAKLDEYNFYRSANEPTFSPEPGDLVLFNRVFLPGAHDHIGIVLENRKESLLVAEGNVNNLSTVLERPKNSKLRGFIRIPDGWIYEE